MPQRIDLISTDFDGTLVDHESANPFPSLLGEVLTRFQKEGGKWVINTGRSLWHAVEGIEIFLGAAQPDYIIANEREIYRWEPGSASWLDVLPWNEQCARDHQVLFHDFKPHMERIADWLNRHTRAQCVREAGVLHGLIADSEREMEAILGFLESIEHECPDLAHQRNLVYLRFCHRLYSKGTALRHLAGLLGITSSTIFAVGDHQNDLSMLTGEPAALVACPINAIDEVKALVQQAEGIVAGARCGSGVLEALGEHLPELVNPLVG